MNRIERTLPNLARGGRNEQDIGLEWLLHVLWERRSLLLVASLLGTLASLLYLHLAAPKYVATARILIDDQRPRVTNGQEIIPYPRFDLGVPMVTQVIESQIALVESPEIAEQVIEKFNLFDSVSAAEGRPKGERQQVAMETRLRNFMARLNVRRHSVSFIVLVSYRDTDNERAAKVANAVAEAYIAREVEAKDKAKRSAIEWLRKRAEELHERVRQESSRLETFKAKNDLVSINGELIKEREVLGTLERLIAARVDLATAEARAKLTEEIAKDPDRIQDVSMALQSPVITEHRKQYADVMRRLTQVVSRFGEGHRDAIAVRAELTDLQEEIAKEAGRLVSGARKDAEMARARARLLENDLTRLIRELNGDRELTVNLRELELDSQTTRDVYASLLTRLKESEIQASLASNDARIVNYAKPPMQADWPRPPVVIASGMIGGLWFALALLLPWEYFRGIVRSSRDIKDDAQLQSVTIMPLTSAAPPSRKASGNGVIGALFQTERRSRSRVLRHTLTNMSSTYAQAVFEIKRLVYSLPSRPDGKIVALVSAQTGEGKSTTAINLADYLALSGEKVLVVDCDLRKPTLTAQIAPDAGVTILDIARGVPDPQSIIIKEPGSGFSFCPGPHGRDCRQPMEILASRHLSAFLTKCKQEYDVIILDTSALQLYVDSRALLGLVDLAILIVEYGRTTNSHIHEVIGQLTSDHDLPIAAVINKAPGRRAG